MNTKIRSILAAASVLALSAITANAQLQINSVTHTYTLVSGSVGFSNSGLTNIVAPTSQAFSPSSGGPTFTVTSTPTLDTYPTAIFPFNPLPAPAPITVGASTQVDQWTLNQLGGTPSFAYTVAIDFNVSKAGFPASTADLISTFLVTITNTGSTSTSYVIAPVSGVAGSFSVGGTGYTYTEIANGRTGDLDSSGSSANAGAFISLKISAVPEPSTYALFGVVGLMGVVAVRRFRSSKKVA